MKIQYVGPFKKVDVSLANGAWLRLEKDEVVDVPNSVASSLLEQVSNWRNADADAVDDHTNTSEDDN